MKKIFYILLAAIVLPMISCSDDPIADAEVRFRLRYGDNPLITLEEFNYPDGNSFYISRVSLFIDDFTLIGDESATLFDIEYFTLTDDHLSSASAEEGTLIYRGELNPDDYRANFSIGVDAASNAMVPADFPSDNPLSNPAEFWAAWNSYVFAKVEGFIDLDGDGEEETGFALHMGGDEAYRTVSINNEMTLDENNKTMYIDIQLDKLFMNDGVMYDIATYPQIHRLEQMPLVMQLCDNLVTCFD